MPKIISITSPILAVVIAITVTGCASNASHRQVPTPTPKATALSSCEQSKQLPPTMDGAARTGTEQQPVLVVGCKVN